MKTNCLLAVVILMTIGVVAAAQAAKKNVAAAEPLSLSSDTLPSHLTDSDLDGSNQDFLQQYEIIEVFPQKLQLANGVPSDGDGKAVTFRKNDQMIIAFYAPDGGGYSLAGNPTVLSSVLPVRMSVHPDNGLPCLVVKKINSATAWRIYLRNGQSTREEFVDEIDLTK